jgi:hypothetical protein
LAEVGFHEVDVYVSWTYKCLFVKRDPFALT